MEDAAPRTATIIPFPDRSKPAEQTPEQRLARALEALNAALAQQQVAIAAWRDGLLALKASTTGLHDSLLRYRTNLATLGDSVSELHDKAQSLEAWADGVTATGD
jgi:sugar (pentulose or hexulose) kinase